MSYGPTTCDQKDPLTMPNEKLTERLNSLKTVVVTGATTGIGLETTRMLAQTGEYRILCIGRSTSALEGALKELGPLAEVVTPFVCELSKPSEIQKLGE